MAHMKKAEKAKAKRYDEAAALKERQSEEMKDITRLVAGKKKVMQPKYVYLCMLVVLYLYGYKHNVCFSVDLDCADWIWHFPMS